MANSLCQRLYETRNLIGYTGISIDYRQHAIGYLENCSNQDYQDKASFLVLDRLVFVFT
jgi:hypothetical protein